MSISTEVKKVYLDNAATTPLFDEVVDLMSDSMREIYGNPSSTHQFGRTAKSAIEAARKSIANMIGVASNELIFTSGGTEANNLILINAVKNLEVRHIITSKVEHHAVLKAIRQLESDFAIQVSYVNILSDGCVDMEHLESLLTASDVKTLVSLMFVNNEVGSILDVAKVTTFCKNYGALFHSDAVQAIGHFDLNIETLGVDFISVSAHKFHGPKGIGFAYFRKGYGVQPMILGGGQEKGARAGTEAVHAILGMDLALQMSLNTLEKDIEHIKKIKTYCVTALSTEIPSIAFNANSDNLKTKTTTLLNVRLPENLPFIMFHLDMKGIAVSGGSACQSGSNVGSHVLNELLDADEANKTSLRMSFNKFTSIADIDYVVKVLKELLEK
ncbi:MAG: cysteine desulfurase family protein [Flavicella sp.]